MSTTVDTLRLIVTWDCNLSCSYCCNHRPDVLDRVQVLPPGGNPVAPVLDPLPHWR